MPQSTQSDTPLIIFTVVEFDRYDAAHSEHSTIEAADIHDAVRKYQDADIARMIEDGPLEEDENPYEQNKWAISDAHNKAGIDFDETSIFIFKQ